MEIKKVSVKQNTANYIDTEYKLANGEIFRTDAREEFDNIGDEAYISLSDETYSFFNYELGSLIESDEFISYDQVKFEKWCERIIKEKIYKYNHIEEDMDFGMIDIICDILRFQAYIAVENIFNVNVFDVVWNTARYFICEVAKYIKKEYDTEKRKVQYESRRIRRRYGRR